MSAVGTNFITFYVILKKNKQPLLAEKFDLPTKRNIDF